MVVELYTRNVSFSSPLTNWSICRLWTVPTIQNKLGADVSVSLIFCNKVQIHALLMQIFSETSKIGVVIID